MAFNKLSLKERLLNKATWKGACLIWGGARFRRSYGLISVNGKLRRAHRVAYELAHGPIPAGYVVMHSCDTPACINPAHLSAAPQAINAKDMHIKGRARFLLGEDAVHGKLTAQNVREIRRRFVTYDRTNGARAMAREFGVTHPSIMAIVHGKAWAHIP